MHLYHNKGIYFKKSMKNFSIQLSCPIELIKIDDDNLLITKENLFNQYLHLHQNLGSKSDAKSSTLPILLGH